MKKNIEEILSKVYEFVYKLDEVRAVLKSLKETVSSTWNRLFKKVDQ